MLVNDGDAACGLPTIEITIRIMTLPDKTVGHEYQRVGILHVGIPQEIVYIGILLKLRVLL